MHDYELPITLNFGAYMLTLNIGAYRLVNFIFEFKDLDQLCQLTSYVLQFGWVEPAI